MWLNILMNVDEHVHNYKSEKKSICDTKNHFVYVPHSGKHSITIDLSSSLALYISPSKSLGGRPGVQKNDFSTYGEDKCMRDHGEKNDYPGLEEAGE